jgi:hypothetical protein
MMLGSINRFAAGAAFGLYMAYLLYFLNPQLEVSPGRIGLAVLVYGTICALLTGAALMLARWGRRKLFGRESESLEPAGLGLLALSVFVSAFVYWSHLMLFRIYLPRGAIQILSKATTLLAAAAFLLFVLWLIERNFSRQRKAVTIGAMIIIALSAFLLYQRRDGYRTVVPAVVHAEVGTIAGENPVIILAIRSLPHDWLITAVGEDLLPNFKELLATSYATRVEPFRTSSQKALWASLATGQLPHRHGVTGRFTYRTPLNRGEERFANLPMGVGFRGWGLIPPVERISANLPAGDSLPFWSFFERVGFRTAVVNWPGTHPVRDLSTMLVSDRFISNGDPDGIAPPAARAAISASRASAQLDTNLTLRLEALRSNDRLATYAFLTSDSRAGQVASTILTESRPALLVAALHGIYDITEQFGIGGSELPPRNTPAGDAIRTQLLLTDRLIGEWRSMNPSAALIVISPSAFHPPPLPGSPDALFRIAREATDPGSNDGFFIANGPHFRHRPNPPVMEIVDVVPTVLFAATLPVARDLDGVIATEAFEESFLRNHTLSVIPTYRATQLIVRE